MVITDQLFNVFAIIGFKDAIFQSTSFKNTRCPLINGLGISCEIGAQLSIVLIYNFDLSKPGELSYELSFFVIFMRTK